MQKTKAKRESRIPNQRLTYVGLSILIAIIGTMMNSLFMATKPYDYLTRRQVEIAVFLFGFITSFLHVQVVERLLKRSMRGWWVLTMVGSLISLLLLGAMDGKWPADGTGLQFMVALILGWPMMLLQTIWLARRFHKAWLMPLVSIGSMLIMPQINLLFINGDSFPLRLVFAALNTTISALVLYTIFARPKHAEKSKVEFAEDEHSDDEASRLERLQERDQQAPLWEIGDDQISHSEA